jgi:hypothetical protein
MILVWKQYAKACGPVTVSNDVSSALKPDAVTESGHWNGGGCDPVTLANDTWDHAARALLTPLAQKVPPPPHPAEADVLPRPRAVRHADGMAAVRLAMTYLRASGGHTRHALHRAHEVLEGDRLA